MKHEPTSCSLSGNLACVVTAQEQELEQWERYHHPPRGTFELLHRKEGEEQEQEQKQKQEEREEEQGEVTMLQRLGNPSSSRSFPLRGLNRRNGITT